MIIHAWIPMCGSGFFFYYPEITVRQHNIIYCILYHKVGLHNKTWLTICFPPCMTFFSILSIISAFLATYSWCTLLEVRPQIIFSIKYARRLIDSAQWTFEHDSLYSISPLSCRTVLVTLLDCVYCQCHALKRHRPLQKCNFFLAPHFINSVISHYNCECEQWMAAQNGRKIILHALHNK